MHTWSKYEFPKYVEYNSKNLENLDEEMKRYLQLADKIATSKVSQTFDNYKIDTVHSD